MIKCNYCNKTLKNIHVLKLHQETTKYCLNLQDKIHIDFSCSYCNKILTTKNSLKTHESTCKKYIEFLYDEKLFKIKEENDNIIKEYEEKLTKSERDERVCVSEYVCV